MFQLKKKKKSEAGPPKKAGNLNTLFELTKPFVPLRTCWFAYISTGFLSL